MTFTSLAARLLARLALPLAASFAAHAAPSYVAHQILGPKGLASLIPQALNDAGTVSGQTAALAPADAFILSARGRYSHFEPFGPGRSDARGLNALGDVAGTSVTDSGGYQAYFKPHGMPAVTLFEPGAVDGSYANAVNASGVVVGTYDAPPGPGTPFMWSNGVLTRLPSLGVDASQPNAINDAGVIVGTSQVYGFHGSHAVKWVDGAIIDLGGLGYTERFGDVAYGVNSAGRVVGYCGTASGWPRGCIWHDGVIDKLSTLGGAFSIAYGINDRDIVVGSSATDAQLQQAVIWKDGTIGNLSDMTVVPDGVILRAAKAINNQGEILVDASSGATDLHYLLVPAGTP